MAEDFERAFEDGLKLSKRIYFGKDRAVTPPKFPTMMIKSMGQSYLPTAPMLYAVIPNPAIVDNPDIPSYQPHVHGKCDPPALLPLQMNGIQLKADCYLDTAFVRVSGSWRLHCVMTSKKCSVRIAVPMGEQGSILSLEVEVSSKLHRTELIPIEDGDKGIEKGNLADGGYLKPNIFTLSIPEVKGGTVLSVRISWSQKLVYRNGEFSLNIPFSFPEYVVPAGLKITKRERIELNVNASAGFEVLCKTISHPLKEMDRHAGRLAFLYESNVYSWSSMDFSFSYNVSPNDIHGAVYLQSPCTQDFDQREMFCVYLLPGSQQSRKVVSKSIVFVVDISGSMHGNPIDATKSVLSTALSNLDQEDSFNIIAFNEETCVFSKSVEFATKEAVQNVVEWMNANFIAGGGTNIFVSLNQAMEMLSSCQRSNPVVFLITDGAVENERGICQKMEECLLDKERKCPRIYTFGIGTFCNHYFLRMLTIISGGEYDAAYDVDMVEARLQKLVVKASSVILSNITLDALNDRDNLDQIEVFPANIPDLSSESPLIISGRYQGKFPETFKAIGVLANLNYFAIELKTHDAEDMPLDRVVAKEQIELLTAQAWFSENKELWDMVVKMSLQTGVISEHTRMIVLEGKEVKETDVRNETQNKKGQLSKTVVPERQKLMMLENLCVGFGNLTATADNIPPGCEEPRLPEVAEMFVKAASNCCSSLCNQCCCMCCIQCCCMCCIQCCTRINNQFIVILAQVFTGLACIGCFKCCEVICCCEDKGQ